MGIVEESLLVAPILDDKYTHLSLFPSLALINFLHLSTFSELYRTHAESISYIEAGESYTYDVNFSTDYAASDSAVFTPRFIP